MWKNRFMTLVMTYYLPVMNMTMLFEFLFEHYNVKIQGILGDIK